MNLNSGDDFGTESQKIRRPANAFMLYANENRKRMAQMYPQESNKEISRRLGNSWKSLSTAEKAKYFDMAKIVDMEHKKKYPDYVYNPKEARLRKAMREATRDRAMGAAPTVPPRPGSRRSSGWASNAEDLMMAPQALRGPMGSPMYANSEFPVASTRSGQFISMNGGCSKIGSVMSPHAPTNYLQVNSLAQFHHQADMWQTYQDAIRTRQSGLQQYVVSHSYLQPRLVQEVITQPLSSLKKSSVEPCSFTNTESNSNENTPSMNNDISNGTLNNKNAVPEKTINDDNVEPEQFMPIYEENVLMSNIFDKSEEIEKMKNISCECFSLKSFSHYEPPKDTLTYLMDPTLAFLINDSTTSGKHELNNQDYMKKYFENFCDYDSIEIFVDSNNSFNYVTYTSHDMKNVSHHTIPNLSSIGSNLVNNLDKYNSGNKNYVLDSSDIQKENNSKKKNF